MISFQTETWAQYSKDALPLWHEMQQDHAADLPVDPDLPAYEHLDRSSKLRILTARDNGSLIGYIVFVVYKHPHHEKILCGHEDAFYLSKTHRKGLTGAKMIREGVRLLASQGVQRVFFTTDAANDCGPLLERIGFAKSNVIYSIWTS